ncbi:MAG: hypothetical protein ACTTJS_02120 [Wolinella sp.]
MESLNINEELAKRREELIQVVERLAQLGSLLSGEQSKYYRMHRRESTVSNILMVIDTIDNELQKTKGNE